MDPAADLAGLRRQLDAALDVIRRPPPGLPKASRRRLTRATVDACVQIAEMVVTVIEESRRLRLENDRLHRALAALAPAGGDRAHRRSDAPAADAAEPRARH